MCLPTVGWVRPPSRAAADSDPVRKTLKNERYRLQSGLPPVIQIYIADLLISSILFHLRHLHPVAYTPTQETRAMATALILGATGGIGHEVASALHRHGWQLNALHRDPGRASGRASWINWVKGDAK